MTNYHNISRTKELLRQIQKHANRLDSFLLRSHNEESYQIQRSEIENILGTNVSLRYLYSEPESYSDKSIFDEESISNTQSLIDVGIFLLTNETISKKVGFYFLNATNIIGFLFDRHTFSYYVHQDKLKKFIDILFELTDNEDNNEKSIFRNPLYLYKILYERNLEIEKLNDENSNLYSNILPLLPKIRKNVKEKYSNNVFSTIFLNEDKIIDKEEPVFTTIKEYHNKAKDFYHSLPDNTEKNIGSFVCLYDTNLEFQKLESTSENIKIRQIDELNFEKVFDENSLIKLALNDEVTILSIKIIN